MLNWVDYDYSSHCRLLEAVVMSVRFSSAGYKDGSKDWHVCMPEDEGPPSNGILLYYEDPVYSVIGRPTHIPEYATDRSVVCKTGEIVPWTGVWVPVTGMGTAALAFARQGLQIMQPAYELAREFAAAEYLEATKQVDTAWHPVKPTGLMVPLPPAGSSGGAADDPTAYPRRVEAGQPCPREGWWTTPAKSDSRRHFKHGEAMPTFTTDYGSTIWQWDDNQS
jgi:hypothetical protein